MSVCWKEEADRWKERWRESETCRSTLRTSPLSEQLLSESWRQHCGALSTPSPTEAPVHAKQAQAASSGCPLSLATLFRPLFVSMYNRHLLIFSPPYLWGWVFIQINFQPSNAVHMVIVTTHAASETILWERTFQGQRLRMYCCFSDQTDCVLLDASIPLHSENKWTCTDWAELFQLRTSAWGCLASGLNIIKLILCFIYFNWQ